MVSKKYCAAYTLCFKTDKLPRDLPVEFARMHDGGLYTGMLNNGLAPVSISQNCA